MAVSRHKKEPAFIYTSKCCGASASKPPCERSEADRRDRKFSESPLGTWVCAACGMSCKVDRRKNQK
jgi:hypothetical protein